MTLAGLPAVQLDRLPTVLNAAARLVLSAQKYDPVSDVTPLLRQLHWLRVPERITFRLATLAFCCQHNMAPRYLAEGIRRAANVAGERRTRSASTDGLVIPRTAHVTIGDRAFNIAAARA